MWQRRFFCAVWRICFCSNFALCYLDMTPLMQQQVGKSKGAADENEVIFERIVIIGDDRIG